MKAIVPSAPHTGSTLVEFARNQPQYDPLPAMVDPSGLVQTEWELSAEELAQVLRGGHLRLWIWTFRHPLQPVAIEITEPDPTMQES
jgi:hypothetical protein